MSQTRPCDHCQNEYHFWKSLCPHCARPAYYPNVIAAQEGVEAAALRGRYEAAKRDARARGDGALRAVEGFEAAMSNTRAVIALSPERAQELLTGDQETYATFYELVEEGKKFPSGDKWDALRTTVDDVLFPHYREEIRFAALTLDDRGLSGFGDCFLVLRTDMIEHRASVYEENSVLFFSKHFRRELDDGPRLPPGHRATWGERARLCVAKLAGRIDDAAEPGAYSGILLRPPSASAADDFVEVHVWGPMTRRTVERIISDKPTRHTSRKVKNRANRQRLANSA